MGYESGPTESNVPGDDEAVERVGMRWDGDHAEALMALKALDQSEESQRYWSICLEIPA
jgi:hypothetical protein